MLDRQAVLVAEDEPFIALDLALAIEEAGGVVVGPASTAGEALALLAEHSVAAAILDFNLIDGDASPIVEYLMERHVPLIIQTGVGIPSALTARFPDLIVHIKPAATARLVAQLEILLAGHDRTGGAREPSPDR